MESTVFKNQFRSNFATLFEYSRQKSIFAPFALKPQFWRKNEIF